MPPNGELIFNLYLIFKELNTNLFVWANLLCHHNFGHHFFSKHIMNKVYILLFLISTTLFKTTLAQWQKVAIPDFPPGVGLINLYDDGQTFWAGGTGQIYKSTDKGATWTNVSNGLQSPISGNSGLAKLGNRVYASFAGNGNYYTYYTTDEGANWVLDTAGWQGPAPVQLHTHGDYILVRLESNFVLYKKNTDAKWQKLVTPDAFRTPGHMYSVGDTLVLGAGYIAMTTDMGQNWTTRQTTYPFPFGFISRLAQDKDNPKTFYADYTILSTNKSKMMVSRNGQITWDSITIPQNYPTSISQIWAKGNDVFTSFAGSFTPADTLTKVFRSQDGGNTWSNITGDLYSQLSFKFHSISSMIYNQGTLFAAGLVIPGGAMVKNVLGGVGLKEHSVSTSLLFYPNPAHSTLTIDKEITRFELYDMNGKPQIIKYNSEDGIIDVSLLPNGLYLAYIERLGVVYTEKLVISN